MSTTGRRRGSRFPSQTTVSLTAEMHQAINEAADRYNITASSIIRDALSRGLKPAIAALAKTGWRR